MKKVMVVLFLLTQALSGNDLVSSEYLREFVREYALSRSSKLALNGVLIEKLPIVVDFFTHKMGRSHEDALRIIQDVKTAYDRAPDDDAPCKAAAKLLKLWFFYHDKTLFYGSDPLRLIDYIGYMVEDAGDLLRIEFVSVNEHEGLIVGAECCNGLIFEYAVRKAMPILKFGLGHIDDIYDRGLCGENFPRIDGSEGFWTRAFDDMFRGVFVRSFDHFFSG